VRQWRESLLPAQRNFAALAVGAADAPAAAAAILASRDLVERFPPARERELFQKYVVPGLQHMALARRSCPLLPRPHIRFARHAAELDRADPPGAYWARARLLAPFDADLWYFSGEQQLRDGQPEEARKSWRRSLELSGRHVDKIIDLAVRDLAGDPRRQVQRLMAEVLPDDPELYLRTIEHLDQDADSQGPLRPLMERGLALVTGHSDALSAREYYLKARFHQYLDQFTEALRDFDQALTIAEAYPNPRLVPLIPVWRRQYIELLLGQEKWKEALRELETLKRQQPYQGIEKDIERIKQKLGLGA
jgi:tetratricopeptide (TPR) repeat protein